MPTVILAPAPEKGKDEMTCHNFHIEMVKAGFYGRNKVQRFKCQLRQTVRRTAREAANVERQNGSLRQWCNSLTRLTYAFSKKVGKSSISARASFCLLQFLPCSWQTEGHASYGSRNY
jgi:hypothetical protein